MPLGVVSNCWKVQLAKCVPLDELIAEAASRGYAAVELREGCLGHYETQEGHVPDARLLKLLPSRFPQVRFNIAIEFPFLDAESCKPGALFDAGLDAARAVAGAYSPHLRLVDLTTVVSDGAVDSERVAKELAALARAVQAIGGTLSVENARQPWDWFWSVFLKARRNLGGDADRLKLCYDPVNLLLSGEAVDPVAVTKSLRPNLISMVHFKQRVSGQIATAVCDGDIDWAAVRAAIERIGFIGPFLFEVASHKRLWEYLAGSREYLRRQGWNFVSPEHD